MEYLGDKLTVDSGDHALVEVKDTGDGTYACTYTPTRQGRYCLKVQIEGTDIKDSPFLVQAGEAPTTWAEGAGLRRGLVGRRNVFTVRSKFETGNAILNRMIAVAFFLRACVCAC